MEVIPAVDVLQGRVVRLVEGDFGRVTEYSADPAAQAARWIELGAARVHVVDLSGARAGSPTPGLLESLARLGIEFQVGGGMRDVAAVRTAVEAGAGRVVVGTVAVDDPGMLGAMIEAVGPEAVVAAIDVREGASLGSGWEGGGRRWQEVVEDAAAAGVRRMLVTGIDRDGTLAGPDLELARAVGALVPGVAVIASGGVGSAADVASAARAGVEGIIVGKALYDGRLTLPEALAAAAGG